MIVIFKDVSTHIQKDFPVKYEIDWDHSVETPDFSPVLGQCAVVFHGLREDYAPLYHYDRTARWTYWQCALFFKNEVDAVHFRLRHG
jgi:hypothetical protein